MFEQAVIVGASGEVGRLLYESLKAGAAARRVLAVDLRAGDGTMAEYLKGDAKNPDAALKEALQQADAVFVCLPESIAIESAGGLLALMPAGALWVDTLSVKAEIVEILTVKAAGRLEAVSINPMFAPNLGWRKKPVALVNVAAGERGRYFAQCLESWGAIVEEVSASEHDKLTAAIQVATHACAIAFGMTLVELGYEAPSGLRLSTPPHRLLLGLLNRIAGQNPEVYWEIQRDHPLGAAARQSLIHSCQQLDNMVQSGERKAFAETMLHIDGVLSGEQARLNGLTSALIRTASEDGWR